MSTVFDSSVQTLFSLLIIYPQLRIPFKTTFSALYRVNYILSSAEDTFFRSCPALSHQPGFRSLTTTDYVMMYSLCGHALWDDLQTHSRRVAQCLIASMLVYLYYRDVKRIRVFARNDCKLLHEAQMHVCPKRHVNYHFPCINPKSSERHTSNNVHCGV